MRFPVAELPGLTNLIRGDSLAEMGDNLPTVDIGGKVHPFLVKSGFANADGHTCVVRDDMRLKCWGAGSGVELANCR